jgi:predicted small lipoprotein YifL
VALNDRRNLMRAALVGVLIAGVALSACGRKGALEPPPGAKTSDASTGDPVADRQAQKPDRPFGLDGLLKSMIRFNGNGSCSRFLGFSQCRTENRFPLFLTLL